ncbi:MAG: MaoC/PaaZ C-terminal domain-containing protein [Steroidobacteraceae bacterium]
MLEYDALRAHDFGSIVQTYTERDTMLYALGLGMGADPLDDGELCFVFEKNLQAVPTMATVIGSPGFFWRDGWTGADWVKLVHGEQHLQLYRTLPTAAAITARNRILSITDKGPGKGALVVIERELRLQATDELVARARMITFLRGDGGYSLHRGRSDQGPEQLPKVPDRDCDVEATLPTIERQALIYRLSGDYNTLHADPSVAKAAGFSRPILHGLCTYGMAVHGLLRTVCRYDASRIRRVAVRFTAPVLPGETVRFEYWDEGRGRYLFRATVDARAAVVLNNGLVELI